MWNKLPILAAKFDGGAGGMMKASFDGLDDATVSGDQFTQKVRCCKMPIAGGRIPVTANGTPFDETVSLDGKPLAIRFYGWRLQLNDDGDWVSPGSL